MYIDFIVIFFWFIGVESVQDAMINDSLSWRAGTMAEDITSMLYDIVWVTSILKLLMSTSLLSDAIISRKHSNAAGFCMLYW